MAHPTSELPDGWWSYVDPRTGAPYYYCMRTGKTQWEWPQEVPSTTHDGTRPRTQDTSRRRVLRDPHRSTSVLDRDAATREHHSASRGGQRRRVMDKKRTERSTSDPMDPSSYSDAPQGDWSRGLNAANP